MLTTVAGGMQRREGPTLAERAAGQPGPPPQEARPARVRIVTRRHCWVQGLPDVPARLAGMLFEWRQSPHRGGGGSRWQGRVVYVAEADTGPIVVEVWIDAEHLTPA